MILELKDNSVCDTDPNTNIQNETTRHSFVNDFCIRSNVMNSFRAERLRIRVHHENKIILLQNQHYIVNPTIKRIKNILDIPSMKRGIWQNPKTTRIANSTYDCLAAWWLILWDRLFLSRGESFCRRWIVTNVLMLNATISMNGMNAEKWKTVI